MSIPPLQRRKYPKDHAKSIIAHSAPLHAIDRPVASGANALARGRWTQDIPEFRDRADLVNRPTHFNLKFF